MSGKKLLVADDSLTIQKVIRLALSNEGYEIQTVSDGHETVQQISLFRPDVVLIDVSLPGKSAFQVKREINALKEFSKTRFVLMSSAFEKVDEIQIQEVGFHGNLTKPFDPAHLRKILIATLDQGAERDPETQGVQSSYPFPQKSDSAPPPSAPPDLPNSNESPTSAPSFKEKTVSTQVRLPAPTSFSLPPPPPSSLSSNSEPIQPPESYSLPDTYEQKTISTQVRLPKNLPSPPSFLPPMIEENEEPPGQPVHPVHPVHLDEKRNLDPEIFLTNNQWEPTSELWDSSPSSPAGKNPDEGATKFPPSVIQNEIQKGIEETDIKELTQTTIGISQPDDFQWSVSEPALKPGTQMTDRGGSNFDFRDNLPPFIKTALPSEKGPPISFINSELQKSRESTTSTQLPPASYSNPPPLSPEQIEEMIHKQVREVLEKMAQNVIPAIAEQIIKQEIHRMLSE